MKTSLFDYELGPELIAQTPSPSRSESRLLVLDRKGGVRLRRIAPTLLDRRFAEIGQFLRAGDCLVLNDTKVLPARFFAERKTGALMEGLFLNSMGEIAGAGVGVGWASAHAVLAAWAEAHPTDAAPLWEVMLKGARKVRPGERIRILDRHRECHCEAELVEKRPDGVCVLRIDSDRNAEEILNEVGFPPLPPYIRRDGDIAQATEDRHRYQTVYARTPGAVAAPTAGLHFTEPLLAQLQQQGVRLAWVTLHVGTGTFKPVTTEDLEDHEIHQEWYEVDEANARAINAARKAGGRIIAVGTTATRVLETVAGCTAGHGQGSGLGGQDTACPIPEPRPLIPSETRNPQSAILHACQGTTDLFITPGYEFKIVDAMITNFHLPRSTLLALVAAFAGLDATLAAYRHAVAQRYRFYSYGDAMLIL
ncbi:MAG: S-adenosylmethionine:tRNA ribosyltransferase-isomerase [Phycisphaerae bacterium]|nr:S-adenosylmethionine:tRNA ribosyltransferase-isomerase [Phycisphaerae bacterium]